MTARGRAKGALVVRGKRAIVTGGGSGIGHGIALALARRGADLALVGRRGSCLEAVAAEAARCGVRAVALPTDLSVTDERDALIARVRAALGPPSLLIHAAGMLAGGPLLNLDTQEIDRAVALNLTAPLALTRAFLPNLAAQRGAIVLIASTAASVPLPSMAIYSATKAGLAAFGEALRYEVAPQGIQVLVAHPPSTATAMTRGMARAAGFPGYRLASAEQVGERIVAALVARQHEWRGGAGERALVLAHRLAPTLVRLALRSQRARFRRMMTTPQQDMMENER